MSNERFRDLKIGDKIFVYCHKEYPKIKEGIVTIIRGYVNYQDLTTRGISIDSMSVEFILPNYNKQSVENLFLITFSEEKSRRGVNYTGFLTIEDVLEFSEEKKNKKIKELEEEMKQEEKRHNDLLIKFQEQNKEDE